RRKDEFLAMLAHELRNPLAPIRNSIQGLRHVVKVEDPVYHRYMDLLDRQVAHLARLVDDLIDVSRITRGRVELRREAITVESVIQQAVEIVRPALEAASHELTVNLPNESVEVDADRTRLVQVLGNLLSNAVKYTQPGGKISVAARVELQEA